MGMSDTASKKSTSNAQAKSSSTEGKSKGALIRNIIIILVVILILLSLGYLVFYMMNKGKSTEESGESTKKLGEGGAGIRQPEKKAELKGNEKSLLKNGTETIKKRNSFDLVNLKERAEDKENFIKNELKETEAVEAIETANN